MINIAHLNMHIINIGYKKTCITNKVHRGNIHIDNAQKKGTYSIKREYIQKMKRENKHIEKIYTV